MKSEVAITISTWPLPDPGAPCPSIVADDSSLLVKYFTADDKTAVIYFPRCTLFTFGLPNDETIAGHPLYAHGLKPYAIHVVQNSTWIDQIERRNAVHPRHDRDSFLEDLNHYIFTFHDSTLECIVTEGRFWQPEINAFDSESEANNYIRQKKNSD